MIGYRAGTHRKNQHGEALHDGARLGIRSGLLAMVVAGFCGLGVLLLAGARISKDLRRQAEMAKQTRLTAMPVPVQLPLRYVPVATTAKGVVAVEKDAGFYWVHDPDIFEHWQGLKSHTGAVLLLVGLRPGRYRLEFWDTMTAK